MNTGSEDKYCLIFSNSSCCFGPQVNSASFFNQKIRVKASIFPDKFDINLLKKFTLSRNFCNSLLQVGAFANFLA
jgi:hypothetical protein